MPLGVILGAMACLLVVARCAAHQRHPLLSLLGSAVCGIAGIAAVALLAPYTGVQLPLNQYTGVVGAVLGLPGVISLLVLNLML